MEVFKVCTKCKKQKPVGGFHVKSKSADGCDPWCKECKKEIKRNYYIKNRDEILKHEKDFYEKDKVKAKSRAKLYYKNNKEKCAARCRKYYKENQASLPIQKCDCGCGNLTNPGGKFVSGHGNRGRKFSKEFCENQSKLKKNTADETRRKMSESAKGKIISIETRRKISEAQKGHRISQSTRLKIGKANKGRKFSKEVRRLNSLRNSGSNHPQWRGGISRLPYCIDWTVELKELIKERDRYLCQNPECWGTCDRLAIHHINYNKLDCDIDNLITLCGSCNTRANHDRRQWQKFYINVMNINQGGASVG